MKATDKVKIRKVLLMKKKMRASKSNNKVKNIFNE